MADRTQQSASSAVNNVIESHVDATSARFEKNMRAMADLVASIHNE